MKISLRSLLYIPIVLFFFPAFMLWIPFLHGAYLYFFIFIYIALILMFLTGFKQHICTLINIYHKTPFKYFFWILVLISINCIFLRHADIIAAIRTIILRIILFVCPIIVYYICIIEKYISLKKFMKLFIFLFWIILIFGIIAYIGQLFNINIINNIFDFFANGRILRYQMINLAQGKTLSNYSAFGLPRLDNLFEEPSFYARYLFLFLPMVYSFGLTKVKLFLNNTMDCIIKRTLIPLTWLNITLTLSPMFLVLSLVITLIYFSKQSMYILKKYGVFISIILLTILILLHNVDISETYLSRISNVFNIRSFDDFIQVEASLATRICSYINSIVIFLHHPFCGVGLGALNSNLFNQFFNSPVSLTPELIRRINVASINKSFAINTNFFVDSLATNGIFITGLFIYFYYKIYKGIVVALNKTSGLDYVIAYSFRYLLISLLIKSCYDSCFLDIDMYFIFSIVFIIIYHTRRKNIIEK